MNTFLTVLTILVVIGAAFVLITWFTRFWVIGLVAGVIALVLVLVFRGEIRDLWDSIGVTYGNKPSISATEKCGNGFLVKDNCQAPSGTTTTQPNSGNCPNGYLTANNCQPNQGSNNGQPVGQPVAGCRQGPGDGYALELLPEVATSGTQLHVEFYRGSEPERETLIPAREADGGRFILTQPLKGHVWEYFNCSDDEVMSQIKAHIGRRLAGHANNAGFVDWKATGLFQPSGRGSAVSAPAAPAPAPAAPAPAPQAQVQAPVAPAPAPAAPAPAPQAQVQAPVAPPAPAAAQCNATQITLSLGDHTVQGPAVVTLWTNRGPQRNERNLKLPSWGQAEVKALIGNETWSILDSSGTAFSYPAGCDPKVDFDKVGLPARTWDELHAADMVK